MSSQTKHIKIGRQSVGRSVIAILFFSFPTQFPRLRLAFGVRRFARNTSVFSRAKRNRKPSDNFFFDMKIPPGIPGFLYPKKFPQKLYPRHLNFFSNLSKDLFVELRRQGYNFWGELLLLNFASKSLPKFQKKFRDKSSPKHYTQAS